MSPIPDTVAFKAEKGDKFPRSFQAFELDGEALVDDHRRLIHEKMYEDRGKFIVYGEDSEEEETRNKAWIIFFPDEEDYSHFTVLRNIRAANRQYELKDCGSAHFVSGAERLYSTSSTLYGQLDTGKQLLWRDYLRKTLGIKVEEPRS